MKNNFWQIIILITGMSIVSWAGLSFANYGESCSVPPRSTLDEYLIQDTAYGYILNHIDMKTHITNGCANTGDNFNFCIKNASGSGSPCTAVTKTIGNSFPLESITNNPDLTKPSLKNIKLTVSVIESDICLTMPTSRGEVPLVCRDAGSGNIGADLGGMSSCRNIAASCYDGNSKSQSLLNFSGLTVQCMRDTLDQVFYKYNSCTSPDEQITFTALNAFPSFQEALKVSVRAALILYVIVYGFKLAMSGEYIQLNKIATFIIKFLLVSYFAVGLGPLYFEYGRETKHNGMTEMALPVLVQFTSDFAEIVFQAGGAQGLCVFDSAKYQQGYEYYKMWDAIDCRIGYYLGMQVLYNIAGFLRDAVSITTTEVGDIIEVAEGNGDAVEALESAFNLSFLITMFGFFLAGNLIIVICGLVFVVIFSSIILYFLTAYLVATVTLYVMAYISPIFITLALFDRTKAYFDSWMKVVISCALQPAVIGGFIALILTMYDSTIYGNCEFQRYDYNLSGLNFSTFELRLPHTDPEKCQNSGGYKLLKYYMTDGWEKYFAIIFVVKIIEDIYNLAVNIVYMMVFSFIFYFFVQKVNEFASDLTSGPSMAAVTASPVMLINATMSAAKKAYDARQKKQKSNDQGQGNTTNRSGGQQGASDKISAAVNSAVDKISSGSAGGSGAAGGGTE